MAKGSGTVSDADPQLQRLLRGGPRPDLRRSASSSEGEGCQPGHGGVRADMILLDIDLPALTAWRPPALRNGASSPIITLDGRRPEQRQGRSPGHGADDYGGQAIRHAGSMLARMRAVPASAATGTAAPPPAPPTFRN